jgi:hypothetical protein
MLFTIFRRSAIGFVLSAIVGLVTPAFAAEPSFPPAVSIGLVLPSGMTPSKGFAGFEHRSGASIIIVEMPAEAYPQIVAGFTPERLRQTGFIANGESEALAVSGGEGRVLRGSQTANGLVYTKWVAVVKGQAGTGLVTVQVPASAEAELPRAEVETALRTIAFRTPVSLDDQIAALPYAVGDMADFRPVRVLAGTSLLLTKGPKDVDPDATQPLIIIASSMGQTTVHKGQESAFARKVFSGLASLKDITVTDENRSVNGSQILVRLRGAAKHVKSDRPMGLTQTVLFSDRGYLRVIGIAPPDAGDALTKADQIAASVAFR